MFESELGGGRYIYLSAVECRVGCDGAILIGHLPNSVINFLLLYFVYITKLFIIDNINNISKIPVKYFIIIFTIKYFFIESLYIE
jgi:hypothetical protein